MSSKYKCSPIMPQMSSALVAEISLVNKEKNNFHLSLNYVIILKLIGIFFDFFCVTYNSSIKNDLVLLHHTFQLTTTAHF